MLSARMPERKPISFLMRWRYWTVILQDSPDELAGGIARACPSPSSHRNEPERLRRATSFSQRAHHFSTRVLGCGLSASWRWVHTPEDRQGRNIHIPATATRNGQGTGFDGEGPSRKKNQKGTCTTLSVVEMTRSWGQFLSSAGMDGCL